jgi:hypothetical protein
MLFATMPEIPQGKEMKGGKLKKLVFCGFT